MMMFVCGLLVGSGNGYSVSWGQQGIRSARTVDKKKDGQSYETPLDLQYEVDQFLYSRTNYLTYCRPRGTSKKKVDAVLLGDSWVDGTWCGLKTWPMTMCEEFGWSYVNAGVCGAELAHVDAQVSRVGKELRARELVVTENTVIIFHCGGNDALSTFARTPHVLCADMLSFARHEIFGGEMCDSLSEVIAQRVCAKVNLVRQRLGGRRFVVAASPPFSLAVPLNCVIATCFLPVLAPSFATALSLSLRERLATALAQTRTDIVFFDEIQALDDAFAAHPGNYASWAIKAWRPDLFHPNQFLHDLLGRAAVASFRDPIDLASVAAGFRSKQQLLHRPIIISEPQLILFPSRGTLIGLLACSILMWPVYSMLLLSVADLITASSTVEDDTTTKMPLPGTVVDATSPLICGGGPPQQEAPPPTSTWRWPAWGLALLS